MTVYKVEREWNCYGNGGKITNLYANKNDAIEAFNKEVKNAKEDFDFAFDVDGKAFEDYTFEQTDSAWCVFEKGFYDENRCEVTLTPMKVK